MPLPKIDQPLFKLTIPSTGEKVMYRPFTVKEEKILLIAQESKDIDQVIIAIKQIIGNCVQDYNIEQLAIFDVEYILLNMRAKSVDNQVSFSITDPGTKEVIELSVDINDIGITSNDSHSRIIQASGDVVLKMRYPRIESVKDIIKGHKEGVGESEKSSALIDIMTSCIETIVQGERVYKLSEFTQTEVTEFVDSLDTAVLMNIKQFFDTMPVMRFESKYKTKDGTEKTFVAEGTETFFL